MQREYQICTRCIMDTSDPNIVFDRNGICNHCRNYDNIAKRHLLSSPEREKRLEEVITKIKESGKNKDYDCVLGLSGGADSSYTAYLVKKFGLRALVVCLDNGWNTEIAVKNIENIVKKLDFDLYTYVIDWKEFKDLQRSFFKASVVDIEILTDHAITALLYKVAAKRGIKYILSGGNIVTETIMPISWSHRKSDLRNIKAIQRLFGTKKIKSFPTAGPLKLAIYRCVNEIKMVNPLDYVSYIREKAMAILEKELGWRRYGRKHGESLFTKFFQNYILPVKFGIDKRRGHYSTLICSGQMTREEALKAMNEELYSPDELKEHKEYVIKKLGFSKDEFEEIMKLPIKSHYDYLTDEVMCDVAAKIESLWARLFGN